MLFPEQSMLFSMPLTSYSVKCLSMPDLLTVATWGLPFTPVEGVVEFDWKWYPGRIEVKQVRPTWKAFFRGKRYDTRPDDSYVRPVTPPFPGHLTSATIDESLKEYKADMRPHRRPSRVDWALKRIGPRAPSTTATLSEIPENPPRFPAAGSPSERSGEFRGKTID